MTTGPLAGWRVLVPRGGEWGERVSSLLTDRGARPTVVPVIEFAPPDDVRPVDEALRRLAQGRYDWLTVTSATTVLALSSRAAVVAGGTPPEALAAVVDRTPVAAVGPATGRALERAGVVPTLTPTGERSARGLAAELPAPSGPPGRVLVPQSDLADATLADGLRAKGWGVDVVVAYRTVTGAVPGHEVREDVRAGWFDAVLLSSGSTVTGLLELVGAPPPTTVVCCIGPRTARTATAHGLTVRVVPPDASAEGLVEALARHAERHPRRRPEEAP